MGQFIHPADSKFGEVVDAEDSARCRANARIICTCTKLTRRCQFQERTKTEIVLCTWEKNCELAKKLVV